MLEEINEENEEERNINILEQSQILLSFFFVFYLFIWLVNGNAKGWVKASRGLRQGDPLSPFLFTIVADVLSRMMLRAEEKVCWRVLG